jgi:hypothetical protein
VNFPDGDYRADVASEFGSKATFAAAAVRDDRTMILVP